MAVSFLEYFEHVICPFVILAEVALLEAELWLSHFVQADGLIFSDQSFAPNCWLYELKQRERIEVEKIWFRDSDSFKLIVFADAADSVFNCHLLLLQNCSQGF